MSDVLAAGYAMRRPEPADAEAVHALIVASDVFEFGESSGYELDELKDDWSRMNLGADAWLAMGPGGEVAGYAFAQQRRYVRLDAEVYVHPEHFGRGIGTTMIRLAEERAREWIPHAPPGTRIVLKNWINARNAEACALLEREGYAPERYFWRMEIELGEAPPEVEWPEGMTVRAAALDEDLRVFFEASEEAMAGHWGHVGSTFEEWIERRTGHGFDPSLWFLAMAGEEPAGVALCRVSEGNGWIDTLAVRQPWRRRGVAMALLRHAFGEYWRRGMRRVALGVDAQGTFGAMGLYEKAGMRVSQQYAGYGKELRAGAEVEEETE
jgi:GNAT superfamily N-acetyltransferase